jgi:thiol-disulfide isomerase/thioredoxin
MEDIELPIRVNKPLPELELELMNGDTLNTKELSDKYVVINWWNTGCKPCIAGIPKLNGLVKKYKTSDVFFLAIALDKRERVENLLRKREFNFTHALGNKKAAEIFGQSYPKYVILNPKRKVIYFRGGGSEERYEQIDRILSKKID